MGLLYTNMKKYLCLITLVLAGLTSCDRPRKEYWDVEINSNCEVWGVNDPAHNVDWIFRDIDERINGVIVLWPSRAGYKEFYTIWTNKEDSENQLVALTRSKSANEQGAAYSHWLLFWDSEYKIVFGESTTQQMIEDDYNYINNHYACTDTICVMTCIK